MKQFVFLMFAILVMAVPASAQSSGPVGSTLAWDQDAPSLATAQSYRYRAIFNGGSSALVVVTCTGAASPFVCSCAIPLEAGSHDVRVSAANVVGGVEGPPNLSAVFNFTLTPLPVAAPRNLRIVPPPVG